MAISSTSNTILNKTQIGSAFCCEDEGFWVEFHFRQGFITEFDSKVFQNVEQPHLDLQLTQQGPNAAPWTGSERQIRHGVMLLSLASREPFWIKYIRFGPELKKLRD